MRVTTGTMSVSVFVCPDCSGYGGHWAWDETQPPDPFDADLPNVYESCDRCGATGDIASQHAWRGPVGEGEPE